MLWDRFFFPKPVTASNLSVQLEIKLFLLWLSNDSATCFSHKFFITTAAMLQNMHGFVTVVLDICIEKRKEKVSTA